LATGGDKFWTAEEYALFGGLFVGIAGGLVGGIIGTFKIKIPINGSHKTYEKKMKLSTYQY